MKLRLLTHPVWLYFNQSLLDRRSVWGLKKFWYLYRIELLRKCWQQQCSQKSHPYH
ncbi:MAG TPA: hypothetical protein ACFCUY_13180 [Xenococcaceae cyanobacterium]